MKTSYLKILGNPCLESEDRTQIIIFEQDLAEIIPRRLGKKIFGNPWKSLEIFGIIWKYLEIFGNPWKSLEKPWKTLEINSGKTSEKP